MRRKVLLVFSMITLILATAGQPSIKLVRLTIVNKSGMDIEVRLTGEIETNFYYLRIPAGDRALPTERVFTIIPDKYHMQAYYIELWDPVYGATCGNAPTETYYATRNTRITFLECGIIPQHKGEPSMVKYTGAWEYIY